MFRRAVDLFTPDEHAILADWFRTKPPGCAQDIPPQDAAKRLGFTKEPFFYLLNDAVVAYIVLEQVERQLPGGPQSPTMASLSLSGTSETSLRSRHRKVAVLPPRHSFSPSIGPTAGRVIAGRWRITSLGFPTIRADLR